MTVLGHGIGQLRNAGDETRVQLVAVVVLRDLRVGHCARDATKALNRRGVDGRRRHNWGIAGLANRNRDRIWSFLVSSSGLVLGRGMRQAH